MKRLLIANRGEIALRILRACHELGIETVAAFTTIDRDLLHLQFASETVCVGRTSYLDVNELLAAAVSRRCDAVHPGYGFLSENDVFAAAVEEAGLIFVGPAPEHISLMADKSAARHYMKGQGVPVIPGSEGELLNSDEAAGLAVQLGYPVMVKASHGGGGRGILPADSEQELRQVISQVNAQAENLFGKAGVYLEKRIHPARHVELQIFGDGEGEVIYLGARDCSIQRMNQKLLEEGSPPGIPEHTLLRLAEKCCLALATLAYRGAGTLEFLYLDGSFYFMEMNTRVQVEHPVTEMLTGIDIVGLQLRLAGGQLQALPAATQRGHVIECRINAEDEHFKPCPGRIERVNFPSGPGIRVDSHIYPGYVVPHQYDSLLAKIVALGENRSMAIARMRQALAEFSIYPLVSNLALHQRILEDPVFVAGGVTTDYISMVSG